MKITKATNNYSNNAVVCAAQTRQNINNNCNIAFKANLSNSRIDEFLRNKLVKKTFKLASLNPFAFNVIAMATTCMIIRPPTILAVPKSNKVDKRYAASKAFIGSAIANIGRLIFILPLGLLLKKAGLKAAKDANYKFPKIGTSRFEAFNYLINNAAGFLLALAMAPLIVYATGKAMLKFMPNSGKIKPQKAQQPIDKNSELKNGDSTTIKLDKEGKK